MTDYATMPAGRELDALVAEKVMGWRWYPLKWNDKQSALAANQASADWLLPGDSIYDQVPCYSSAIDHAWVVVVEMLSEWEFGCDTVGYATNADGTVVRQWRVWFWKNDPPDGTGPHCCEDADTAPLAICRAAIAAVEAQ